MELNPDTEKSSAARSAINRLPPRQRSRVSNGSSLLNGVDGRRASARRFRDLIADLTREEFGDSENLSIAELGLLRQAAALTLQAERLQAAVVRGETVNADELVRLSSENRRVLAAMRRSKRASPPEPPKETFADLAARAQAKANIRRARELAEDGEE